MNDENHNPTEARAAILSSDDKALPKELVLTWMREPDIEILGELYVLINKERFIKRITPPLEFKEAHDFTVSYLRRVLMNDHKGDWSGGRYEAGWNLAALFSSYWGNKDVPRDGVVELKKFLADLCMAGDEALRLCIITSVLEHLFEKSDIRDYFRDWQNDVRLRATYEEAEKYAHDLGAKSQAPENTKGQV